MAIPKALLWTTAGIFIAGGTLGYLGCKALGKAIFGDVGALAAELPKEIEAARHDGLPVEPKELFPHRPYKDGENAGPTVVKETKAIYELIPSSDPAIAATGRIAKGEATFQDESALAEAFQKCEPHFKNLFAVIDCSYCDFGHDYSLGWKLLFPEFAHLKQTVKLLGAKAVLDARAGKLADAQVDLQTCFHLAAYAGREPVLIGALVQIACAAISQRDLRQLIFENSKNPRCLALASAVLEKSDPAPDFPLCLNGELVLGLITIGGINSVKDLQEISGSQESPSSVPMSLLPANMKEAWMTRFLQFWRRVNSRMPQEKTDFLRIAKVLHEEQEREDAHKSLDYLINRLLLPIFDQGALAGAKDRSDHALSEATIDLFKYRSAHGSFPSKLSDLPGKYIDAFDGKSLRYRKTSSGFRIYSIDRDLHDDSGQKLDPKNSSTPHDFVVEYPQVPS